MTDLLLDTTVVIDFLRGNKKAANYLAHLVTPTISIITEAEIYQGAKNKSDIKTWEKFLIRFKIIPITAEISRLAIKLLKKYRLSHGLHILDALIAAIAIENSLALVTENTKHFSYIKDLKVISR